jgi:hypothetical protein
MLLDKQLAAQQSNADAELDIRRQQADYASDPNNPKNIDTLAHAGYLTRGGAPALPPPPDPAAALSNGMKSTSAATSFQPNPSLPDPGPTAADREMGFLQRLGVIAPDAAAAPAAPALPDADQAIAWAKAHPDDPRAKQILQRLGQ